MDGKVTTTHGYLTGKSGYTTLYRNFTIPGSNVPTITNVTINFRFWAVCNWANNRAEVILTHYEKNGTSTHNLWISPFYSYNNPTQISEWNGFVYAKNISQQWYSGSCSYLFALNPPMTSVYQNVSVSYFIYNSSIDNTFNR